MNSFAVRSTKIASSHTQSHFICWICWGYISFLSFIWWLWLLSTTIDSNSAWLTTFTCICTGFNYKRHFAKSTYWEFHCSRSNESKNDTDDPLNILVFVARIIQLYYCDALQSFDVPTLRCFNVDDGSLWMHIYAHIFTLVFRLVSKKIHNAT